MAIPNKVYIFINQINKYIHSQIETDSNVFIPSRIAVFKKNDNIRYCQDHGQLEFFYVCNVNAITFGK